MFDGSPHKTPHIVATAVEKLVVMKARRKRPGVKGAIEGVVDNPFESRSTIHKKHDVFNRKVKGEKRNVARARGQATQRREKTLLVDYERSHKANSFRDRRYA